MGFDVYHNPTAAAIGNVAFTAGTGQFAQALAARNIQNRQLDLQEANLNFRAREAVAARQFQAQRDQDYQKFQLDMQREQQRIRHEDFEHRYTSQQRLRIKQINEDIEALDQDETLTEEQKTVARSQLNALRYGIKKMPIPKAQSPYPPGQNVGENWVDKSGGVMTRDRNGNAKMLVKPPDITKLYDTIMKNMTIKPDSLTGEKGFTPTHAQVTARVNEIMQLHRQNMGLQFDAPQRAAEGAQEGRTITGQDITGEQAMQMIREDDPFAASRRREAARAEIEDPLSSRPKMVQTGTESGPSGVRQEMPQEVRTRIESALREDQPEFEAEATPEEQQAARQQMFERLVQEIDLSEPEQKQLKKNESLIERALQTGKKITSGFKPVEGGTWIGKFNSAAEKERKVAFRDQNALVISRAMSIMNSPEMPPAVRKDMRDVAQELMSVLKDADYTVPDRETSRIVPETKKSLENRTRAQRLAAVLVDFINNPARFTQR